MASTGTPPYSAALRRGVPLSVVERAESLYSATPPRTIGRRSRNGGVGPNSVFTFPGEFMRPEVLTSITTPASVSLDCKQTTALELAERQHWFRPGGATSPGKMRWGDVKSTHVARKAQWSLAECGMACRNLDPVFFAAMRYSHALDDSQIPTLRKALYRFGELQQRRHGWFENMVPRPKRKTFLDDLIDLALLEDRSPHRFKATPEGGKGRPADIKPLLMGVSVATWRHKLSGPYETLRDEYALWLAIAAAHMWRALADERDALG